MGLLNKMLNKNELSIDDLEYISKLLHTNTSLNQCFQLLKTKSNEKIFNQIQKELSKGVAIEESIKNYLPKQIRNYMLGLLSTLSFSSSLDLALEFYSNNKENETHILNEIAYPCILLFISISVLYLFDLYGMDTIFNLISTFNTNLDLFSSMRMIFRIIINLFYYGILFSLALIIFFLKPSRVSLLYLFISKHFPNSLANIYCCEEFISLLLACVSRGYKTKESLNILKGIKNKPIISFLAFHLDESLLEGESLKDAAKRNYYDSSLSRFIKIGNYTNDFVNMLQNYVYLSKTKIDKKIKRYTLTIQLSTYAFIGVIVIFIYQILFVPMQALSGF